MWVNVHPILVGVFHRRSIVLLRRRRWDGVLIVFGDSGRWGDVRVFVGDRGTLVVGGGVGVLVLVNVSVQGRGRGGRVVVLSQRVPVQGDIPIR